MAESEAATCSALVSTWGSAWGATVAICPVSHAPVVVALVGAGTGLLGAAAVLGFECVCFEDVLDILESAFGGFDAVDEDA